MPGQSVEELTAMIHAAREPIGSALVAEGGGGGAGPCGEVNEEDYREDNGSDTDMQASFRQELLLGPL
jgi:hypothetical protein